MPHHSDEEKPSSAKVSKDKKKTKRDKKSRSRSSSADSKTRSKRKKSRSDKLQEVDIDMLITNMQPTDPTMFAGTEAPLAPNVAPPQGTGTGTPPPNTAGMNAPVPQVLPLVIAQTALTVAAPTTVNTAFLAAAREARRVHVSNLPKTVNEAELREIFGSWCEVLRRTILLRETGRDPPAEAVLTIDQVLDIHINATGSQPYAFLELSMEDMATELCNTQEQIEYDNMKVKIRRPRDYKPMSGVDHCKVIVAGLPETLEEPQLKELMASFGELLAFAFVPAKHEGATSYCYAEYDNTTSVENVIKQLHGEDLGGKLLVAYALSDTLRATLQKLGVQISTSSNDPSLSTADSQQDVVKELLDMKLTLQQSVALLSVAFPHLKPVVGMNFPVFPTRILVLLNIIDPEELESDVDYYKLKDVIANEVEKYGRVKQLLIPRSLPPPPRPPEPFVPQKVAPPVQLLPLSTPFGGVDTAAPTSAETKSPEQVEYEHAMEQNAKGEEEYQRQKDAFLAARQQWENDCEDPVKSGIGRVFVEYLTVEEAESAQAQLAGRLFNGRTVITSFLFEDILYPPEESEPSAANKLVEELSRDGKSEVQPPQPDTNPNETPASPPTEQSAQPPDASGID